MIYVKGNKWIWETVDAYTFKIICISDRKKYGSFEYKTKNFKYKNLKKAIRRYVEKKNKQ